MWDRVGAFVGVAVLLAAVDWRSVVSDVTAVAVLITAVGGATIMVGRPIRKWLKAKEEAEKAARRRDERIAKAIDEELPSMSRQLSEMHVRGQERHAHLDIRIDKIENHLRRQDAWARPRHSVLGSEHHHVDDEDKEST